MPQYFTGADPNTAFASGLMAGYEFIDRIQSRREQLRLQKRAEARDDERFGMQKEQHATSQKVAGLQIEDLQGDIKDEASERKYRDERRPIEQAKADVLYGQQVEAGGLQSAAARAALQAQEDLRRGRAAYGSLIESTAQPPTLGGIGSQGVVATSEPPPASPGASGAPASARVPSSTPAIPTDLRVAQQQIDAQPNIFERGVQAVKKSFAEGQRKAGERDTKGAWAEIANTQVSGNSRVVSERLPSVQIRDVRLNPTKYAAAYIQDRDKVDVADRQVLDNTMLAATKERLEQVNTQMKALDAKDPKNQPKFAALLNQRVEADAAVDKLTKAMAKTAGAEVLPNGGTVAANDPNVLPVITKAAQSREANGVLPKVTESSLRLTQTQLGRMDNPARLNKQQLGWVSEAFRTGAIDAATYSNWVRYGGPLAPAKPQIIPFGAGKGVVLYPNGQLAEIDFGDGKGKGGKDGDGASFGQSIELLKDTLNARIKRGDIPDAVEGTGINEMGKMLLLLQRHGGQFQQQNPEIDLLDENGELSMEWAKNPVEAVKVMNWYVDVLNGIDEPDETTDPIPDSEDAAAIIPTTPLVQ